jgi:hypothetical protein
MLLAVAEKTEKHCICGNFVQQHDFVQQHERKQDTGWVPAKPKQLQFADESDDLNFKWIINKYLFILCAS